MPLGGFTPPIAQYIWARSGTDLAVRSGPDRCQIGARSVPDLARIWARSGKRLANVWQTSGKRRASFEYVKLIIASLNCFPKSRHDFCKRKKSKQFLTKLILVFENVMI